MGTNLYLWHDSIAIDILEIAERHFSTFMFVYPDLWMVDVRDPFKRNCSILSVQTILITSRPCKPLSWITVLVTRTAVSVVICTGPSLRPEKPFSRSSDVLSTAIQLIRIARSDYCPTSGRVISFIRALIIPFRVVISVDPT